MVAISLFSLLSLDEHVGSLALSALGAWVIFRHLKPHAHWAVAITAILGTPFAQAAIAGFSSLAFSAVYLIALRFFVTGQHRPFYASILVLCLVRPDGVVWGLAPCIAMLATSLKGKQYGAVRDAFTFLVLPGIAYFALRAAYFGEWLPLPFLVKAAGVRDLGPFFSSSLEPVLSVFLPVLILGLATRDRDTIVKLGLIALVPALFYMSMRLEQNLGNRFLAPMFFASAFVLLMRDRVIGTLFVLAVVFAGARTTVGTFLNNVDSRNESVFYLARDLAGVRGKMLVTEAGRLAYYSRWQTHDSWGLNTPAYAKRMINEQDLQAQQYDLIVAHCDLDMLKRDNERDSGRSWHNQCVALINFIRNSPHEVYLAPFLLDEPLVNRVKALLGLTPSNCARFDIYAIRADSALRRRIAQILERHGGFRYRSTLNVVGDRVCR
jgi:hypothetical protein